MAVGRPSLYSATLAHEICTRIASGESLRHICEDDHMPWARTVHSWLIDERFPIFHQQYARARAIQAEMMFEEILEIADDKEQDTIETGEDGEGTRFNSEHYQRSRLRVDTRKWYLSKVLPKKFGEKLDVTSLGEKVAAVTGFNFIRNGDDNTNNQTHA